MFVVDLERFKALCALYFFNTIQPEELEELKTALNSGENELRKIFNQAKKDIKGSPLSIRFIDTYIDDNEDYVKESKLKDIWNYSFYRLFFSYWFSKIKLKFILILSFVFFLSIIIISIFAINLNNQIKEVKGEISVKKSELSLKENLLTVLQSKDFYSTELKGQSINPDGYGRVICSPSEQKSILIVADLPPAGKSKVYQIWLNKGGTYYNKGTITLSNNDSETFLNIPYSSLNKNDSDYSYIVTLEKIGNNTKPSGTVYLYGAMVH
ncbi:MAG: anti-sigma factor [Ignavibacteriaceae bacterium]|nr:anti-sigma factor [Ignavibacteriaceae bacterium]